MNVGTHASPSRRVSQPTWSACRCVCTTVSMRSGANPAAVKRSRNGQSWSFQNGSASVLPLPTHGSTITVRVPVSTTSACTRRVMLPSASAHRPWSSTHGCAVTPAAVATGKKNSGGMCAVSSSTTLVIRASPTVQDWVSVLMTGR